MGKKMRPTSRSASIHALTVIRRMHGSMNPGLEHDLSAQLHHARRRVEAQEVAVWARRRSLHGADRSEKWSIAKIRVREAKVRVIEYVERLGADCEVEPFFKLKILEQVHVHIEVARSAILIAALRRIWFAIPSWAGCVQERVGIQTLGHRDHRSVKACIRFAATARLGVANDGAQNRVTTIEDGSAKIAIRNGIGQSCTP